MIAVPGFTAETQPQCLACFIGILIATTAGGCTIMVLRSWGGTEALPIGGLGIAVGVCLIFIGWKMMGNNRELRP